MCCSKGCYLTKIAIAVLLLLLISGCSDECTCPGDNVSDHIRGRVMDIDGVAIGGALILISYDNPIEIKPRMEIEFNIPSAQQVRLWIEDPCDGMVIIELFNGIADEGPLSVIWDAHNGNGELITEGKYLAKIDGETYSDDYDFFLFMGGYDGYDSPEGMLGFATTDSGGNFSFSQECLDFGAVVEYEGISYVISRTVNIWAIMEGYQATSSDWTTISVTKGVELELYMTHIP